MASAFRRRVPQLSLLALFAFIVALLSGLHAAASPVRFTISGEEVRYGDNLYIVSSNFSEGGVTSELTNDRGSYQRLTDSRNDLGRVFSLFSASGASVGSTVHVNDTVYVNVQNFDRGLPFYWTWAKEGRMKFLQARRTWPNGAAKFKIVAPNFIPLIYPPRYWYRLVSCPGLYCSGLSRYPADGVTYIKLGEKWSLGDLRVEFKRSGSPRISMSTDT